MNEAQHLEYLTPSYWVLFKLFILLVIVYRYAKKKGYLNG